MSASKTMNGDTGKPPSIDLRVIRNLIKHENDLINNRLTWFINIQGLLFAALGGAWGL